MSISASADWPRAICSAFSRSESFSRRPSVATGSTAITSTLSTRSRPARR